MAVASAGQYASLHLAPDRQPRQYPTTLFFTGQMPFLPPNQQRQSTEGTLHHLYVPPLIESYLECTSEDMPTTRVIAPTSHQRILMKGCVLEILSDFYSHDTMLVQVVAVALCLSVCLSQVSVLSKQMDESSMNTSFHLSYSV